jgi:hypothetical protein
MGYEETCRASVRIGDVEPNPSKEIVIKGDLPMQGWARGNNTAGAVERTSMKQLVPCGYTVAKKCHSWMIAKLTASISLCKCYTPSYW